MSAESPREGLRLFALLIAADLRSGSQALVEPAETVHRDAPCRGRKRTLVVAVAAHRLAARAA